MTQGPQTQQTRFIPEHESDYQPEPDELDPAAQADDGEDPPPEFDEDDDLDSDD